MARRKKSQFSDKDKFVLFMVLILFGFVLGTKVNSLNLARFRLPFLAQRVSAQYSISARELKERLENKKFVFINVHTPYEGEIEKTDLFIEFDSMKASQAQLPQDKNTGIILYCKSGNMSAEALQTLKGMGYTNVAHLSGGMNSWQREGFEIFDLSDLPSQVLPEEGFELPISWGDMGPKLISLGVIDRAKFEDVVQMTDEQKTILSRGSNAKIKIDSTNSQFVVDMLWAFGLAQRSKVYSEGPMGKEYKDRVGNFASTGGWSLARGSAVNYLNNYDLVNLTSEQQDRVVEISKGVFRPCCGNPTWFPDCNHGMAALAAIELMVHAGMSDEDIYRNILKLNSFWFPQHYLTLATHFARQGTSWDKVDVKLALGEEYSSGQASGKLFQEVGPLPYEGFQGGSCGA